MEFKFSSGHIKKSKETSENNVNDVLFNLIYLKNYVISTCNPYKNY